MKTFSIFCALLFTLVYPVVAQERGYSFKENYAVSAPAQLSISTSDGNIEVVPSNDKGIQVYYVVKKGNKLQKISRQELEKEVNVSVEQHSNSLSIKIEQKNQNWVGFNFGNGLEVGFILHVPRETAAKLRTSDGNISIKGLSANQELHTSDGNIRIADVKGNINGKTSDGNVSLHNISGNLNIRTSDGDIQLGNIVGNVQISTSDGNIRLEQVRGYVSLKTSDGDISFDKLSGSLKASTSDGNIRGSIVDLKKELVLKTSDGTIDVTVPNQLGLDLMMKGSSLSVPLQNFSGRSDKKIIQGKMNGGGIAVNLSSSDGFVKLAFVK